MRTVVSRRKLAKLCYTVAGLIQTLELTTDEYFLWVTDELLNVKFVGSINENNPVVINGILSGHNFEFNIKVDETKETGGSIIDFVELCAEVAHLPKDVQLIELSEVKGNFKIKIMR